MTSERPSPRELRDAYRFPGFTPSRTVRGVAGDPGAVVIALTRREKKRRAGRVGRRAGRGTIDDRGTSGIFRAARCTCDWSSSCDAWTVASAAV